MFSISGKLFEIILSAKRVMLVFLLLQKLKEFEETKFHEKLVFYLFGRKKHGIITVENIFPYVQLFSLITSSRTEIQNN